MTLLLNNCLLLEMTKYTHYQTQLCETLIKHLLIIFHVYSTTYYPQLLKSFKISKDNSQLSNVQ
jgi:hypothetical protein